MKGFVSYAHADAAVSQKMRPHLMTLERHFDLKLWMDREIKAGMVWEKSIKDAIAAADVFVLLITADFMASDYIYTKEIPAIMERRNAAGGLVLPVVLRPCQWTTVAADLQALPTTEAGKLLPVTEWKPQDNGCNRATGQMVAAIAAHFSVQPKKLNWGSA